MTGPRITPVILSGGSGTRLWPLSRHARPKQMIALGGATSLLAQTLDRASGPLFAAPVLVGSAAQAEALALAAPGAHAIILEPTARNTAPAILLAALEAGPDALLLVMPSDHVVLDAEAFRLAVESAVPAAGQGWIVTFGIHPDRPETGYGYIEAGAPLDGDIRRVRRFVEKPDVAGAERLIAEGGLWNAGIFLMRSDVLVAGLADHAPELLAAVREAHDKAVRDGVTVSPDSHAFGRAPSISIDHALMEKSDRLAVRPCAFGWSDLGSFDSLHRLGPADESGNVVEGEAVLVGAEGCLVHSDGPIVAAVGVSDLVIIATGDAVLVVPRGHSQRVRELAEAVRNLKGEKWS